MFFLNVTFINALLVNNDVYLVFDYHTFHNFYFCHHDDLNMVCFCCDRDFYHHDDLRMAYFYCDLDLFLVLEFIFLMTDFFCQDWSHLFFFLLILFGKQELCTNDQLPKYQDAYIFQVHNLASIFQTNFCIDLCILNKIQENSLLSLFRLHFQQGVFLVNPLGSTILKRNQFFQFKDLFYQQPLQDKIHRRFQKAL